MLWKWNTTGNSNLLFLYIFATCAHHLFLGNISTTKRPFLCVASHLYQIDVYNWVFVGTYFWRLFLMNISMASAATARNTNVKQILKPRAKARVESRSEMVRKCNHDMPYCLQLCPGSCKFWTWGVSCRFNLRCIFQKNVFIKWKITLILVF